MKNYISLIAVFFLLACQHNSSPIKELYVLPKKLKEVSGITSSQQLGFIWALEDSGNPNAIYGLDTNGVLAQTITITNATNIDWEDITHDKEGNLYLGDFGNNENTRTDLCIYKIDKKGLKNNSTASTSKISFAYPEQKDFPPKKKELFYDVEGFFEFKNNFYLFTKNRSKGFDGTTFLYKVPNINGFHQAQLIGKFKTCGDYNHCVITSAAISPDGLKVVILSHDKIWLFENFKGDNFLSGTKTTFDLNHFSQKEAICFKNNDIVLIADEKTKKIGGKVYEVSIKKLKSKS